jgi:hypothetical protein
MSSTLARILLRGVLAWLLGGMPSDPFLLVMLLSLLLSVHILKHFGELKYLVKFRLRFQACFILFFQKALEVF